MTTVLHGQNQVGSRQRLLSLKEEYRKRGFEIVVLNGKATTFSQIQLSAQNFSLLGEGTVVFVEDFFGRKKSEPRRAEEFDGEIIFWEGKEISKPTLATFPKNWKIESFPFPRAIFRFLEDITPGKPQKCITDLHQLLLTEEAQLVLPLLAWHVRQLLWAKEDTKTLNIPAWKAGRLANQASKFTPEELYLLHQKLLNLDRDLKTGTNPLPLASSLDLLLASL